MKAEDTAAVLEAVVAAGPSGAMVVGLVGDEGFVTTLVGLMVVAAKLSRNGEHSDKWRFGLFLLILHGLLKRTQDVRTDPRLWCERCHPPPAGADRRDGIDRSGRGTSDSAQQLHPSRGQQSHK